jgi:dihydroorotate dehydrogenase
LAIKSLKFNFVPNVLEEDKNNPLFKTTLFDKNLENPIGMAAGFDKNAEVYNSLFKLGFGFVEVGTITPLKQYGNPKPRVFRLVEDEALINRLGFNNLGSKNVLDRIRSNKQTGLLGINIGPNKDSDNRLEDYANCFRSFHDVADYITINISSPNTEDLRNFHDQIKLNELLESIYKEKKNLGSKIPIAVKISPDINDKEIKKITEVLLSNNIEAVIISNTSDSSRNKLNDIQKHQKGGLSGKPIEENSTKLVNKFYKLLNGKIKIIGCGGVDSGKSAYEKFLAGADYVQLYTGMVFRGPNIVNMIKKELKELLIVDGVKNFAEIIGKK